MIEYSFEQLINADQLRQLLEAHHCLSGMAYGIYDSNENHITSAGWQEICTRFHRVHPVYSARCRESKMYFQANLHEAGDGFLEYRCRNGMIDAAMPVIVEERHLATFYIGQFFYADDPPDRTFFIDQAREFGFDQDAYLAALDRAPVLSREHVRANVKFLHSMVRLMAESGLKSFQLGLKLANETEQNRLIEEQHAIFGFALDQMREAAFVIDENGRFHYVNQEACRSLGYSRDELTGITVPDINPDFTGEMAFQNVQRLYKAGSHTFETRHRAKDGHIFPVEITATLFKHHGVTYNLSLARDITERKRAEEQAQHMREIFLDTLLDTVPVPIYYKDRQAKYLGFNKAFEEFFGISKERLIGRTVFDISPPELAEIYNRHDMALFEQGGIQRYESSVRNTKDELRNVVFNKAVFTDHDGKPCGMIGAIVDITEHKVAEQRLKESETRYRHSSNLLASILESAASVSVYALDREYRYLAFNRRHKQGMNYLWGADIAVGMSMLDAVASEEYREKMRKVFDEVLTGRSLSTEARFLIMKDGREVPEYYENHGSPIFNYEGDVVGLTFFAINITDRKKTEQALRMSQFIVDNASIGIYRSHEDGRILYANEASARMLGYNREELCSMTFFDIVQDMGEQRWLDHRRLLRATGSRKFEAVHRRKDGTTLPVEVSANCLEFGNETVSCSFSQDITERKRMEEMLRRREREFRTLAENSPDVIVRYGRDLRRLYVSPAFAGMVEGGAAALIGKTPSEYHPNHSDATIYERKLEEVFATGKTLEFEEKWENSNESEICNLFILTPEFGENGAVESVLAIGRDITELQRSSNILLEKQRRLSAMAIELSMAEERERRRIAANLHDIVGQDLALARIKLGLLSKKLHDNEERELLEGAHKLMNGVIKGVRSLTHLITPPILQSSGLEAALQWLVRQMKEEYGLMVEFRDDHLEKPLSREAQTDLYFAVRELLINVVKHSGTKRATVSLFREKDTYNIVVEDDGLGFIVVDNDVGKAADSGGFGLFNIRRRIMYFGGVLEIDSSSCNGARITLKIPLIKV